MIIGNIHHLELVPYLPQKIKQAIEYVRDNINSNTPVGRYDIEGDNVFLMLSESAVRKAVDAKPEYHARYIDIQIILSGPEGMAVSTLPPHSQMLDNKLAENDIAFIETPDEETLFVLNSNDFIVLYPNEVHKPLCSVDASKSTIRKVVVKVALDCLPN